jgi:hypothetical protein
MTQRPITKPRRAKVRDGVVGKTRVLVLNADYTPLGLIGWKRAVVLVARNEDNPDIGAESIDFYPDKKILSSGGRYFPVPAVIRHVRYKRTKGKRVSFSKKNVFLRDKMTCVYCGHKDITGDTLTFDHVVPRKIWKEHNYKGTPTQWTNIVTCCRSCNLSKGDRTRFGQICYRR